MNEITPPAIIPKLPRGHKHLHIPSPATTKLCNEHPQLCSHLKPPSISRPHKTRHIHKPPKKTKFPPYYPVLVRVSRRPRTLTDDSNSTLYAEELGNVTLVREKRSDRPTSRGSVKYATNRPSEIAQKESFSDTVQTRLVHGKKEMKKLGNQGIELKVETTTISNVGTTADLVAELKVENTTVKNIETTTAAVAELSQEEDYVTEEGDIEDDEPSVVQTATSEPGKVAVNDEEVIISAETKETLKESGVSEDNPDIYKTLAKILKHKDAISRDEALIKAGNSTKLDEYKTYWRLEYNIPGHP